MKKIFLIFVFALLIFSCYKVQADEFTTQFYSHVNTLRESKDLPILEVNYKTTNVAYTYSKILAENGKINHEALSPFEFSELCTNCNVPDVTLLEILTSCPKDYVPYQIFLLFMESDPHREALLDPRGQSIGAGYFIRDANMFFTAYIIIEKE